MQDPIDVIIIGAGTAGLTALSAVRKRTDNFLVINDGPWGTTCARVGCMPSKALIAAANAFHARHRMKEFGILGSDAIRVEVPAVLRRIRALRDTFVAATLDVTNALGERAMSGRAQLLGGDRLRINGHELRARRIILATGSTPLVPEPLLALSETLLTTDSLFEQHTLPQRIAVVGQGALGVEMAQALRRLGLDVFAFGDTETIAGLTDPAVNAVAVSLLQRELPLRLGAKPEFSAQELGEGVGIRVRAPGFETVVDRVLATSGRRPNIEGLGLETLGVALNADGLPEVDQATMQVGGLPVFMVGDVTAQSTVLHEASDEGHIAGLNATAETSASFQRRVPMQIVFSDPTIATVGKRFAELDASQAIVGEALFEDQGRARIQQRNSGILHVYADRQTGRILGAELCAPAGEHLAHLLALAIERSLTVPEFLRMPFYHPVFEEGLRTALHGLSRQLPTPADSDLARSGTA